MDALGRALLCIAPSLSEMLAGPFPRQSTPSPNITTHLLGTKIVLVMNGITAERDNLKAKVF